MSPGMGTWNAASRPALLDTHANNFADASVKVFLVEFVEEVEFA